MRKSRFSEQQIIAVLKEHEAGMSTAEVCRRHGVSQPALPGGRNERWSLDFVSDALADGRRFRILAIVDDFTRECLALVADTSLSGLRVVRELDALIIARGRPAMIVSDNGTELTSTAVLRWSQERQVEWHYIAPANRSRTLSSKASTGARVTSC